MSHNPFARPRPNPKRKEPRRVIGRVRLYGEEKTAERRRIFERSCGKCEAMRFTAVGVFNGRSVGLKERCNEPITWETMHMSHLAHGPRRNDKETIASCAGCHRNEHNAGGKPVPRKAGRKMNHMEAYGYWKGTKCFCEGEKRSMTSFCAECTAKLSPQARYDLENTTGRDYLKTVALAEETLLAWKPAEEHKCS